MRPRLQPICTDYKVWYARLDLAIDGGPTNRGKQPFIALVEISSFATCGSSLPQR